MPIINEVITQLKIIFNREFNNDIKQAYLIGRNTEDITIRDDIDFIIVIDDKINAWILMNKLSEEIVKLILLYKVYISCFPIKESDFIQEKTMFIRNAKRYGKLI